MYSHLGNETSCNRSPKTQLLYVFFIYIILALSTLCYKMDVHVTWKRAQINLDAQPWEWGGLWIYINWFNCKGVRIPLNQKSGVLDMTLKCIWWWGSDSGDCRGCVLLLSEYVTLELAASESEFSSVFYGHHFMISSTTNTTQIFTST